MRVLAIDQDSYERNAVVLDAVFRLRSDIFQGRLGWNVHVTDGREEDEYDHLTPTYIVALCNIDDVLGCARLLPAVGPTMVANTFHELLSPDSFKPHSAMVESSRFCVDTSRPAGRDDGGLHHITRALFAGIIEWSITKGFSEIVTVTDIRFERVLKRAGWPLTRLGPARPIGNTVAVAGTLPVNNEHFCRLKPPGYRSEFSHSLAAA